MMMLNRFQMTGSLDVPFVLARQSLLTIHNSLPEHEAVIAKARDVLERAGEEIVRFFDDLNQRKRRFIRIVPVMNGAANGMVSFITGNVTAVSYDGVGTLRMRVRNAGGIKWGDAEVELAKVLQIQVWEPAKG